MDLAEARGGLSRDGGRSGSGARARAVAKRQQVSADSGAVPQKNRILPKLALRFRRAQVGLHLSIGGKMRKKIGRPRRRFWFRLDHVDETIAFDLVGEVVFASVDGQRFAASRTKNWRWVGLAGGQYAVLLRELNRPHHPPLKPRPVR